MPGDATAYPKRYTAAVGWKVARPVDLLAPALAGLALVLCLVVWIAPAYRRRPFKLLLVAAVMIPYPASLVAITPALFASSGIRCTPRRRASVAT